MKNAVEGGSQNECQNAEENRDQNYNSHGHTLILLSTSCVAKEDEPNHKNLYQLLS